MPIKSYLASLCLSLVIAGPVCAQSIPPRMNFQGRLARPDGTPVSSANAQTLTFRLFDALTGGNKLWEQTFNGSVITRNGAFTVNLDLSVGFTSGNTLNSVFAGVAGAPWLEIVTGSGTSAVTLTPRQPFSSNAYAVLAQNVPDGSINGNKVAGGSITSDKLSSALQTTLAPFGFGPSLADGAPLPATPNALFVSSAYAKLYTTSAGGSKSKLVIHDISTPNFGLPPVLTQTAALNLTIAPSAVTEETRTFGNVGTYAYVSSSTNGALQILDVTNPSNTFVLSAVSSLSPGKVVVYQGYAYVIDTGASRLKVIDARAPAAPVTLADAPLSGIASDIAISGSYLYVTVPNSSAIQIFSLSAPAAPASVGTVATAYPTRMTTAFGYAYVAAAKKLLVYDLSAPSAPVLVGSVVTSTEFFDPNVVGIAYSSSSVYLVDNRSNGFQNISILKAFDVTSPTAPTQRGQIYTGTNAVGMGAYNSRVYVACGDCSAAQVFDGSSIGATFTGNLTLANNLGVDGNLIVTGKLKVGSLVGQMNLSSGIAVDSTGLNSGSLAQSLTFGPDNTEGISSKRTSSGNQYGLDFYTAGQNRLAITSAGNVGVGTTTPGYKLDVNGSLRCYSFTNSSDARLKTNIAALDNALNSLLDLRGVSYDWNQAAFPDRNFPDGRQMGFIAQEVEKIFPELVMTDAEGYKSVNYIGIVPVLVESVKTQQKRLKVLEADNQALKAQLETLAKAVRELQQGSKTRQ